MSDESRIYITIEYEAEFRVSELWPDGDAPQMVTREEVMALIERDGLHRVASDWFFPTPRVSIGFAGFDEHGRRKNAERLWTGG